MYLLNRYTNLNEKIIIRPVSLSELKAIDRSKQFNFKWEAERKKEVYQLQLETTGEILGLMSIEDIPEEVRIDISTLEASKENIGSGKKHEGIAGCLIAYACRTAFLRGYGGFISLTPKTTLIQHYISIYGFVEMGRKLCSFDENSKKLIEKYFKKEP